MKQIFYAVLIFTLVSMSCTPFKMTVSNELKESHDEYAVKGRTGALIKQKLSFGEYHTERIKRSWIKSGAGLSSFGAGYPGTNNYTGLISAEYIDRKQTIFFSLADGAQHLSEVYCTSRFNALDFTIGKKENSFLNIALDIFGSGATSENKYYVQIYTALDEMPWQMIIDNKAAQAHAKTYTGVLARDRDHYYTIVPVTKLEKNGKSGNILAGSIGFEFRDAQNKAVAAVSLIDKGMVFLGKINERDRFLLANASAALLLQENIG